MTRLQQEVRVGGDLGRDVDDHGRTDQPLGWHLVDGPAVLAGHPVRRRVDVGAGVLAGVDVVPLPHRSVVVEVADRLQTEGDRVRERRRELQHRGRRRQRRGQVEDLDPPRGERPTAGWSARGRQTRYLSLYRSSDYYRQSKFAIHCRRRCSDAFEVLRRGELDRQPALGPAAVDLDPGVQAIGQLTGDLAGSWMGFTRRSRGARRGGRFLGIAEGDDLLGGPD